MIYLYYLHMPIIVLHILKYNIAYRVMIGRHILQLGGWVGWSWHLVPKILASLQWIQITSPPPLSLILRWGCLNWRTGLLVTMMWHEPNFTPILCYYKHLLLMRTLSTIYMVPQFWSFWDWVTIGLESIMPWQMSWFWVLKCRGGMSGYGKL